MRSVASTLIAWLILAGCGYRWIDEPHVFAGRARGIEIEVFENLSAEPGVERMLADAVHEEFLRRGGLLPTFDRGEAELVMRGVVRGVSVQHTAFSSVALAIEDQVRLEVEVSVLHADAGEPVLPEHRITQEEHFDSSADPQVYESNKEQAMRRIAARIAARIHDELFQTF